MTKLHIKKETQKKKKKNCKPCKVCSFTKMGKLPTALSNNHIEAAKDIYL
jgi:hypothetical protein